MRLFEIRSEWDDVWRLTVSGKTTCMGSFAEAARRLELDAPTDNVFDAAYASEFDMTVTFDGTAFVVYFRDENAVSPPMASLAEAQVLTQPLRGG